MFCVLTFLLESPHRGDSSKYKQDTIFNIVQTISINYAQYNNVCSYGILYGPSLFAVKAKIYGVLYNQASSIAFDETSSYWSALKSS